MKFKFGVQNLSYCRPGCHRSPKPSGERTIQRPPESPNAWPHAFSQGLMNVETPTPPGLVAPSRPRADSAPPLSRCPRALRSARANSTPVDSCRLPSIPVDSALGRLGATRACERGRVREGPRTNGKSKCSETRPMGAGCRQIESVALCVWQCHLRNVSTLSNRTHYRCQRPTILSRARMWYTVGEDPPFRFLH